MAQQPSNSFPFVVEPPPGASPAPLITGVSPDPIYAGQVVTITGLYFGATQQSSTVTFGGVLATPLWWSATSIIVPVPIGAVSGPIVVTVASPASPAVPPVLAAVVAGTGTSLVLTGTDFLATQGASTVTFGGVLATVTAWAITSITITPPQNVLSGPVVVTVGGLASNAVNYTVALPPQVILTSVSPTSGSVGTVLTLMGSGFGASQGTGTITIGGAVATPSSWGNTVITVPVPVGATSGNILVTAGGLSGNVLAFTVTTPSLTGLSVTSGAVGSSVTLMGLAFGATQGGSTVTFNGTAATATSWSATSVTVTVPNGATTGNVVITVNAVAATGLPFTITATPVPITNTGMSGLGSLPGTGSTITCALNTTFAVGNCVTLGVAIATPGVTVTGFNDDTTNGPLGWTLAAALTVGSIRVELWSTSVSIAQSGGSYVNVVLSGTAFAAATLDVFAGVLALGRTGTASGSGANPSIAIVTEDVNNFVVGAFASSGSGLAAALTGSLRRSTSSGGATPVVSSLVDNQGALAASLTDAITLAATSWVAAALELRSGANALSLTGVSPNSGMIGASVTLTGTNFGATQGGSTVKFNGTTATPSSWSPTSITVPVPGGATTGSVVVNVASTNSNSMTFTVTTGAVGYTSHPERAIYTLPALPTLPAAGGTFTDPTFGSPSSRTTDQNTKAGVSFRTASNQNSRMWASDGSQYWTNCTDGSIFLWAFNATTMVSTQYLTQLPFNAEPTFDDSHANLLYGQGSAYADHVTIVQYNTSTHTATLLVDLATVSVPAPAGTYTNAIDCQNGTLMVLYGGASQDAHYLVLIWNVAAQTYSVVNTLTHAGLGFHLHSCALDKTGRYLMLSPANADVQAGLATSQIYYVDLNTNTAYEITVAPFGHTCSGFNGYFINNDVPSGTWDPAQYALRNLTTGGPNNPVDVISPVLSPQRNTNLTFMGEHSSWNAAVATAMAPIITGFYLFGVLTPWRAWDDEIVAISTDGSFNVWRFCHHFSDVSQDTNANNYQFEYTPRANCNPAGTFAAYTSNMLKTLGLDPDGGLHRQDVFVVKLT